MEAHIGTGNTKFILFFILGKRITDIGSESVTQGWFLKWLEANMKKK